jgi:hypothetical protein
VPAAAIPLDAFLGCSRDGWSELRRGDGIAWMSSMPARLGRSSSPVSTPSMAVRRPPPPRIRSLPSSDSRTDSSRLFPFSFFHNRTTVICSQRRAVPARHRWTLAWSCCGHAPYSGRSTRRGRPPPMSWLPWPRSALSLACSPSSTSTPPYCAQLASVQHPNTQSCNDDSSSLH